MPKLPGVAPKTGNIGMHIAGTALGFGFSYLEFRERVRSGENLLLAGAKAGTAGVLYATMGFMPVLALLQGPGLVKAGTTAAYNRYRSYQTWRREIASPFSHSFSHTDATLRAQQQGIQALGIGRGFVGSEAAMMAQRYGRR